MYPYAVFLDIDLYTIFLLLGILAAIIFFRVLTGKTNLSAKVFNFSLIVGIAAIVFGYLSAVLFQMFYDAIATGKWEWGSGATFYGGLIGAAVSFLLFYFVIGHFVFKDKQHIKEFNVMLCSIMPCIVVAHGLGRIGCLFAGCCHGAETDSWVGIPMYDHTHKDFINFVPIQLFEALFLFALFGVLVYLLIKRRNEYTASIYLIAYGVWRFVIEFWRDDDRGSIGFDGLSPSQLTAIIMVATGVALIFLYKFVLKRVFANIGTAEKIDETNKE